MNQMFDGCSSLTTLNLGAWNTAKVTNMNQMFYGCSALVAILVGPEWNTGAVQFSDLMFDGCTNIKGSDGATYDNTKLDKTYARISDGGENKGYMTGGMLKTQLAEGRRWATWCCSDGRTYVIDEDEDADANAYAAEYDAENSRLILHKIGNGKVIPANNVVIIVADKDNENIIMNIDDDAQAEMPTNHLLARKYHEDLSYEGDIYVLGMVNGKFGFHKYDKRFYLPFYKAFLHITRSTGGSARAITFSFADDITGVETIDNGQLTIDNYAGADVWYTINGVKLNGKPTAPGMYINSGKKIIIK
jgi:surface protein